ncbi:PIR protein [Plasmodium ovale]|uniref:PIR protein n=1 Tax=Plasmodium ovale TaxID=36330 RepID=A0A1D3JFB6_PLAOA|nr:PIR protein [Plasmodium ovale]
MSALDEDPFFKKYGQKYSFLLELPLYAIYSILHNAYTLTYEDPLCESEIHNNSVHSNEIRQVCKVLQEHLPELEGLIQTHELDDVNKVCEYFNFWIYDKVKHINNSYDNIQSLYNAINTLQSSGSLANKCSNIKNFKISADKFNEKKELFFHTENLFLIQKKYNKILNNDSSLYEKYLEECAEYYKKIILNNYCKNNEEYKSELIYFNNKYNKTKNYLKSQGIAITLEDLQSPELYKCSSEAKSGAEEPDSPRLVDRQNLDGGYPSSEVSTSDGTTTDPGTIAGTGLGISFVIFLSYLFLYKFKGYQTFTRPVIKKGKKMLNNLEDEDNEFFHISEPNQINLDSISYHLIYNSA